MFIGAALRLHADGQRFLLRHGQVALIGVDVVVEVAFVAVEAGRGGIVGAPAVPFLIPPDAAQPGGGFIRREAGAFDRRDGRNGPKFTPFIEGMEGGLAALAQRHAGGDEQRGGGARRQSGGGLFERGRFIEGGGVGQSVRGGWGSGAIRLRLICICLILWAEHVEIGGEILRHDAGEGGVGPRGRAVGHAVEAGEHRHGEAVVVAVAGDFACLHVLADHLLMAGQRTGEQIIGEAGAGDEDGRVPAEAKGRAVAADAQGIGGAGADLRGFAGGADDAGGGEGFEEGALAGGAPAVGADLIGGRGEGGEVVGHGKAPFYGRVCRDGIRGEGL